MTAGHDRRRLRAGAGHRLLAHGRSCARLGEKNTRLRIRPALISASASGIEHATKSTPPAARSVSAVAAPVDGTQRIEPGETPSACISPASATCQLPPCPVPEATTLFGFALICANSSLTFL